jgi:protease-4
MLRGQPTRLAAPGAPLAVAAGMRRLLAMIRRLLTGRRLAPGKVAVLRLYGPITGGQRSAEWLESVRKLRTSKRVPAVVLDIDSPGGSAAAADYLFLALQRLNAEKPLVAHVRGTGASGAYLAAMAARHLVVAPNSLIGSIGVISAGPRLPALLERLGISVEEHTAGRLKGSGAPWRESNDEERVKEQAIVDAYYDAFVARVGAGRRLADGRVRELATGEVWLGWRAVELGLADEVGDLERAVEVAAQIAGVEPEVATVEIKRPLLGRLLERAVTRAARRLADAIEAELWERGPRA